MFRKIATLATAAAMVATPVIAQANPAQALSVSGRAAADMQDEDGIVWSAGTIIIGLVVVGLVIYGITEITSDDDDSESP